MHGSTEARKKRQEIKNDKNGRPATNADRLLKIEGLVSGRDGQPAKKLYAPVLCRRLNRPLKKSIVKCFEGRSFSPALSLPNGCAGASLYVFVVTRRP